MLNAVPITALRARGAHRAERLALGEIHGVARAQERVEIAAPGRVDPDEITEHREDGRLVEDHPMRDAIAERAHHDLGVVREAARRVALGPAAALFERLRQVPVVERRKRADARVEQAVDEPPVVVEPLRVRAAASPCGWMRGQAIEKRQLVWFIARISAMSSAKR